MRAPQEFIALTPIPGPNGVRAYNPGDDVPASAVKNLGLVVGTQVRTSSPDVLDRPAGNAKRAEWEAYWRAQGLDQDIIDGMTRDDMAAKEPLVAAPDPVVGSPVALPGEAVAGVSVVANPLPDVAAVQATEQANGPAEQVEEPQRPASGARKAEWVTYAVARGMPKDVAEDSTIDQLAAADYSLFRS
jgi:hypothetical protein